MSIICIVLTRFSGWGE